MKIRVTVDTDKCDLSEMGSVERGTYGVAIDGVQHWWYGSPSTFVEFFDVEVIECKHDWTNYDRDYKGHSRNTPSNVCYYCEQEKEEVMLKDGITTWVIKHKNGHIKEVLDDSLNCKCVNLG